MKYIKVTKENKRKNKYFFRGNGENSIYKKGLPNSFNGVVNQEGNYKNSPNHEEDGWFDYITTPINSITQQLGQIYFDEIEKVYKNEIIELDEEQINQNKEAYKIEQVKGFLSQKKQDGSNIFEDFELRITTQLIGMPILEVQAIVSQIDELLYKPLNLVKTGDFASAMFLFMTATPPENDFILVFWIELRTKTQLYYSENYPTEKI